MIDCTPERNAQFVTDYRGGKAIRQIAREAGLTPRAVRYHIQKADGRVLRKKGMKYKADPSTYLESRLRYLPEQLEKLEAKLERLRAEAREYGLIR